MFQSYYLALSFTDFNRGSDKHGKIKDCPFEHKVIKQHIYIYNLRDVVKQYRIKLQCHQLKYIVISVVYRPPDCEPNCLELSRNPSYIQDLLLRKPVFNLGDLNCNILKQTEENYMTRNVSQHENISNSLWKIINRYIPQSPQLNQLIPKTHRLYEMSSTNTFPLWDHQPPLKLLNWRWTTTLRLDISNSYSDDTQWSDGEQFNFRRVSCYKVYKLVSSMPSNKSPGIDLITMQVLKDSLPIILLTVLLLHLYFPMPGRNQF